MSTRIFLFRHVSWIRRILGLPVKGTKFTEGVFGETTASGYTVLDTDKLIASGKLKDDLEKFAQERNPRPPR